MLTVLLTDDVEGVCDAIGGNPEWGVSASEVRERLLSEARALAGRVRADADAGILVHIASKTRHVTDRFLCFRDVTGALIVGCAPTTTWCGLTPVTEIDLRKKGV